jgi:hypothetical protein
MDEKQFSTLMEKLNTLIRLLSLSVISGKSLREQMKILASAKFSHKEIADIVGTTADSVKVTLYQMRKERRRKKGEARKQKK